MADLQGGEGSEIRTDGISGDTDGPLDCIDSPSTALCAVERMARYGRDVENGAASRYDAAVNMALVACEAASPHDRFRLIETPNENFLLVTNALPRDNGRRTALNNHVRSADDFFDAVEAVGSSSGRDRDGCYGREYALRGVTRLTREGTLVGGAYIIYGRGHLEQALTLDKRDMIDRILRHVDTPGLLDQHNVCDVEALLWLLFCGPRSFCDSDRCLGYDKDGAGVPFPALLPPLFYEPVTDYLTYVNLAELYVHAWYRGYDFPADGDQGSDGLTHAVTLDRIKETLCLVRSRFDGREVPVWTEQSRVCLFCALYQQNRLCLDFANTEAFTTAYSPIVLKDCQCAVTDVVLSHVLPGRDTVTLFPVYNIGRLLCAFQRTPEGGVRFEDS